MTAGAGVRIQGAWRPVTIFPNDNDNDTMKTYETRADTRSILEIPRVFFLFLEEESPALVTTTTGMAVQAVLARVALPPVYAYEDARGIRTATRRSAEMVRDLGGFVKGYLALPDGTRFGDLPPVLQNRLEDTLIGIHTFDRSWEFTDEDFEACERLTGILG